MTRRERSQESSLSYWYCLTHLDSVEIMWTMSKTIAWRGSCQRESVQAMTTGWG
jgi:hypothetical protein